MGVLSNSFVPRTLGVVADTHGLVRPELERALAGCEQILHAGDIGGPEVLASLECIAPVAVVRGNNDSEPWASAIPEVSVLEFGDVRVSLLHDIADLDTESIRARGSAQVVITGHSHRPLIEEREGVLFLNPGSAGPRRFRLPVTCARLSLGPDGPRAHLIDLMNLDGA